MVQIHRINQGASEVVNTINFIRTLLYFTKIFYQKSQQKYPTQQIRHKGTGTWMLHYSIKQRTRQYFVKPKTAKNTEYWHLSEII